MPESTLSHSKKSGLNHSRRHQSETGSDSPSDSAPTTSHKLKSAKHTVGHRLHTRVPSSKGLHKLTKAHTDHVSTTKLRRQASPVSPPVSPMKRVGSEPKLLREGSTTSLKKNSSHTALRRNRSHVEVKRPKSTTAIKRSSSHTNVSKSSNRTSVHFDLGDEPEDAWTEASGSASPTLSRAGSAGNQSSGRNSAKPPASVSNSQSQSPAASPSKSRTGSKDWTQEADRQSLRNSTPDAQQITNRLLKRVPSHGVAPKMSTISATATTSTLSSADEFKYTSTPTTDKSELISRFKGSAGASNSTSPFLTTHARPEPKSKRRDLDDTRRAKSLSNLTRQERNESAADDSSSDDRALAPRSRKSSTTSTPSHAYIPPQQSRTQQKLWLQRASSNIEPLAQQIPSTGLGLGLPVSALGVGGLGLGIAGLGVSPLVGAGYDGPDPRIRMQLERTGQEYLVVRRYQDPVARALKRLSVIPGTERSRRIPGSRGKRASGTEGKSGNLGLSQSLREGRNRVANGVNGGSGGRSSFEGVESTAGSLDSERGAESDGGLGAILRGLWEKNAEVAGSTE